MKYLMLLVLVFMTACTHPEKQNERSLASNANHILFTREVSGFMTSVAFIIENKNSKFGYDFYMSPKPRNKYAPANETILVSQRQVISVEYKTSSGTPSNHFEKDGEMIVWVQGQSSEFPKAAFSFNVNGRMYDSFGSNAQFSIPGQMGVQAYKQVSSVTADVLKNVSVTSPLGGSRATLADIVAQSK